MKTDSHHPLETVVVLACEMVKKKIFNLIHCIQINARNYQNDKSIKSAEHRN